MLQDLMLYADIMSGFESSMLQYGIQGDILFHVS